MLFNFIGPEIFILFFGLLSLASFALTIWAVVEIASKPFVREKDKVLWLILVLLVGVVGPIVYLTQRKKLLARFNPGASDDYDRLDINQPRPEARRRDERQDDDYV